MLSLRIYYWHCFFSGGEEEQLCEVSCQAIHDHISHSFSPLVDSGHRVFILDSGHHSLAPPYDQGASGETVFIADCRKNGRREVGLVTNI